MEPRALVIGSRPGDRYRAGRTLRALRRADVPAEDCCGWAPDALGEALAAGPAWVVRAGAWLPQPGPWHPPPPSATGLPLCALGHVLPAPDAAPARDNEATVTSAYLEAPCAAAVGQRVAAGEEPELALEAEAGSGRYRVVRYEPLDVCDDAALRVLQVVTSLQQGGAERVTLDLAEELKRSEVCCRVVTLGRPTRGAFPDPPGLIDLSGMGDRPARLEALAEVALAFGADLVHGHLLDGETAAAMSARGLPLVLTVHNLRPGWPRGLAGLRAGDAALLAACAGAVEADLRAAGVPVPARVAWNGIDCAPYALPERDRVRRAWRHQQRLGAADLVLLAVANPRRQKRLHLLPAMLAATRQELRRRGIRREARLVFVGETKRLAPEAVAELRGARAEVARLGLRRHVCWLGAVTDVATSLAGADVLVSASAFEGLSLAQLEALASGLPVVTTAVGGAAEVAHRNPAVFLVPPDRPPEQFAATIVDATARPCEGGQAAAAVHFTRGRMAERYRWLYPRAVEAARGRRPGDGLWLVTNNFSTGGAQSSARRLLAGLASQAVRVRAATLQEQPEYPTPGRKLLAAAGVPVLALPPAGTADHVTLVTELLERLDADRPAAVLLWNALTEYKLLLADALLDVPVYDVSPGEMYYASLERYFARPRPGLPYRTPAEYGARLAGVIVKYQAEAGRAAAVLGAPVHVVPNGVPLGAEPERARPPGGPLVLGTAARLSPQKKLEDLLTALRLAHGRLPPYVLRVGGGVEPGCDGYAEGLRRLSAGLPVEWLGDLDDTSPFLHGLDLFVLVAEPAGCPNASLEAMAEGLAVVATDVGGMAEQVEDGVTGRLVPRADPDALAEALVQLARDAELRRRFAAASQRRAEARFSLGRMVADYRRVCLLS
jgi:glycosyltransferase involved in cell wall biosynthesis